MHLRKSYSVVGVSKSAVQTLEALLSFVTDEKRLIVYASNKVLCERALRSDGTIRRHIGELVSAGLVARRSSSNGKRFRVHNPDGADECFGIDVGPLLSRSDELQQAADFCAIQDQRKRLVRSQVLALVAQIEQAPCPPKDAVAEAKLYLRRKMDLEGWRALHAQLEALIAIVAPAPASSETAIMSASNNENERHIQDQKEELLMDSGASSETTVTMSSVAICNENAGSVETAALNQEATQQMDVESVKQALPSAFSFAPAPVRTAQDLISFGWSLASFVAIPERLLRQAAQKWGVETVVLTVLGIIERGAKISNPGGYFRSVLLGRNQERFNVRSFVLSAA